MKILLCDDNALFLETFRKKVRELLNIEKIDAAVYAYPSLEDIPDSILSSCNIFFLDIDFCSISQNGMELARKIRKRNSDAIIVFITNYIEYAPEGYEVSAFRYLLKKDIDTKLQPCMRDIIKRFFAEQKRIKITASGEVISVKVSDIVFVEADKHNVIMHVQALTHSKEKTYKFYSSLTDIERQLIPSGFLRIQKSYLANMDRIEKMNCQETIFDNGISLRISQKNYAELKKIYLLWKGKQ